MYKIYADNTLIYDSTIEDYKISKGLVTLETSNKSGSFVFGVYSDHFFYDRFIRLKTVITVYKDARIVFRGRILNDVSDFFNNKIITCEGELGFLQDAIIRPYNFNGTPEELFIKFVTEYNAQVDDFKKFKIGTVTIVDANNYIARSNSEYESAYNNMMSRLIDDSLGGYFHITHGDDGADPIPTIHYIADFTELSTQRIEFGENLKNYTKTVKAEEIATAIIPLGATVDDGNEETEDKRLTIESVNAGLDYVFNASAVALRGWICKVVTWDDVTDASNLKKKAEAYLLEVINQNVTIEVNAIDLHLLDRDIASFGVGQYIPISSKPHDFEATLLCNKQTIDLLNPANDSLTLGYTYSTFTEYSSKATNNSLAVINLEINKATNAVKTELIQKIDEEVEDQALEMQRLTALMTQSLGVFKSEEVLEDGSIVYYMHDKQLLSQSTIIWKMTADAFAVSTDGGKTWNAGLDSSGNAVVNVLSAIGIQAEWLDVDNLSAISANIGEWSIDNNGLYKTVTNENTLYRVYLKAPIHNKDAVLRCEKSTDGGSSFASSFILYADGSTKFGNTSIDENGNVFLSWDDGRRVVMDNRGIWFYDENNVEIGSFVYSARQGGLVVQTVNLSTQKINGSEGYTGTVYGSKTDGSPISLTFNRGVLTSYSG